MDAMARFGIGFSGILANYVGRSRLFDMVAKEKIKEGRLRLASSPLQRHPKAPLGFEAHALIREDVLRRSAATLLLRLGDREGRRNKTFVGLS
jgi:hypothetical protein